MPNEPIEASAANRTWFNRSELMVEARFDMTPIAAQALAKRGDHDVSVAHETYAVPAQEETKRAWIESFRSLGLCGLGVLFLYFVIDVARSHLDGKELAYVLAATVGAPVISYGVYRFTKPKQTSLQPSSLVNPPIP